MKKIEIFLFVMLLTSWVVKESVGLMKYDGLVLTFGVLLSVTYLVGNYWINKPSTKTFTSILITILYGVFSSCLTFLLLFKMFFLTGTDEMAVLSTILLVGVITIDLVINRIKNIILNKWTTRRILIISLVILILYLIPESTRVNFTYRKYPEFLKYYAENKSTMSVYAIYEEYSRNSDDKN